MKKNLVKGCWLSFAALALMLSACNAEKDELNDASDDKVAVRLRAVVDGVPQLRASWSISDPYTENPDWNKNEIFKWQTGDLLTSLTLGGTAGVQYGVSLKTENDQPADMANMNVRLPKNGLAWFFYPSTDIFNVDTTTADVRNASVGLSISPLQNRNNQSKYVYLRTDSIVVKDGKVVNDVINFNHLTSVLRFHLLNSTKRKYTVKQIRIAASYPKVFLMSASYRMASKGFDVQQTQNNSSYADELVWDNLDYQKNPMVDDLSTTAREDVYDALLLTFPVTGEELLKSKLTVYVTLYDTEKRTEFALEPKTLDPNKSQSSYNKFSLGFPRALRTYFNIRINENNTFDIVIGDYPGGWGLESDEIVIQ